MSIFLIIYAVYLGRFLYKLIQDNGETPVGFFSTAFLFGGGIYLVSLTFSEELCLFTFLSLAVGIFGLIFGLFFICFFISEMRSQEYEDRHSFHHSSNDDIMSASDCLPWEVEQRVAEHNDMLSAGHSPVNLESIVNYDGEYDMDAVERNISSMENDYNPED